ncbi:unnamed protein product [Paramecium octaurelia]|uniref:Uncharacterized protein n=1 Tax=Paramecium octaurelia TaxID=43137 RepID=A0A8S1V0Q9_PAROT|nr:unnamed protein product [Paramecium octaurelia]
MAFCQGKSILIKDTLKLTKYIDLCLKTPVHYKGIQNSIGYHKIMVAQFNFKEFNKGLFPQFINLIGRDFKEIDTQEFNYFIQALSCYVESATHQNVYDKQIFESVIDSISLNATYIQKCLFFITLYLYSGFYKLLPLSMEAVDKFQDKLFKQVPQTGEEHLWRILIEIHLVEGRRNIEGHTEGFKKTESQIMAKFIILIEKIDIFLTKQTNIMSRIMLLKHFSTYQHSYPQLFDNRIQKLIFQIQTNSHDYIQENLSSLNSFEFQLYIDLFSKSKEMFQSAKWDVILNEINSRNLNEMPIQDVIFQIQAIMKNKKMTRQLGNKYIQHLYENVDSINSQSYAEVFQIIHLINSDIKKDQLVTKLQLKVVPKDLPLQHVSLILFALKSFRQIDRNILEKYLEGIENRINDIDNKTAMGILSALNLVSQQHPLIFAQIQKLKLNDQQDQLLLREILRYLQLHDPQNEQAIKVQEAFVRLLNKQFNIELICSILEILYNFNQQTKKSITLIPELKIYIKRGIDQLKSFNPDKQNNNDHQMEFLRKQYQIDE